MHDDAVLKCSFTKMQIWRGIRLQAAQRNMAVGAVAQTPRALVSAIGRLTVTRTKNASRMIAHGSAPAAATGYRRYRLCAQFALNPKVYHPGTVDAFSRKNLFALDEAWKDAEVLRGTGDLCAEIIWASANTRRMPPDHHLLPTCSVHPARPHTSRVLFALSEPHLSTLHHLKMARTLRMSSKAV